jgi:hypothetical protein
MGTPRAIGDALGRRLKARIQLLSQYLAEQLAAGAQLSGSQLRTPRDIRETIRPYVSTAGALEPALAMELEAMAAAAEVTIEDLLVIQGYTDLLSTSGSVSPGTPSTFVGCSAEQAQNGKPCQVLVWEADPALLPFVTLVHRVPSHGPASLSLTLAGLHPIAMLNEAGIAVCSNSLLVNDSAYGHFTTHIVASLMTVPSYEDALHRAQAAPRWGGRAIHLLAANGDRASIELSGDRTAILPDLMRNAPRVHTNHPLDESIQPVGRSDAFSRVRLENLAALAVRSTQVTPSEVLRWFGLSGGTPGPTTGETTTRKRRGSVSNPDACIALYLDPGERIIYLRRGPGMGMDAKRI